MAGRLPPIAVPRPPSNLPPGITDAASAGSPPAVISQQDARAWRFPAAGAGLLLDGVVTSPPYPAAYDYLAHARRVRSLWPADPAAGDAVVPPRGSRDWPEGRASRGPWSHLNAPYFTPFVILHTKV